MNEDPVNESAATPEPPAGAVPPPAGDAAASAAATEAHSDPSQDAPGSPPEAEAGAGPTRKKRRRRRRKSKPAGETAAAPDGEAAGDATVSADPTSNPATATRPPRKRRERPAKRPERRRADSGAPPGRGPRPSQGPAQLASIAVRALAEMAERLLDVEGVDQLGRPRFLEVRVKVPLDAQRDGTQAARQAVEQIVARVRDVREHEAALQPGCVFCYFSNSASGPHSRPPGVRQVFEGYGSTGRPSYADFLTLAIDRRAEGIERLSAGEDVVVTSVSMGRVLRTQQLQEFGNGSPVFRVLGQVDAGLYALAGSDEKAAFSFQLLRAQTLDGMTRFRLHWVGHADLRDVADPMVLAILKRFQQKLDHGSLRFQGMDANGTAVDDEEFVQPFLTDLAKQLSGRARRAAQRTGHANERVEEQQRPTTKCWDDAREAGDDRILRDDEQGTLVVVGPKNRVHVFAPDAKHVTSLVLTGSQVQRRLQEGRWHPAEPEDRGEFRIALRRRVGEGADAPAPTDPAADG